VQLGQPLGYHFCAVLQRLLPEAIAARAANAQWINLLIRAGIRIARTIVFQ
jgi:hypothetical protein